MLKKVAAGQEETIGEKLEKRGEDILETLDIFVKFSNCDSIKSFWQLVLMLLLLISGVHYQILMLSLENLKI